MPLSSLRQYLDKHEIKYIVISHSVAYTAQGIAALTHIPGKELAKTDCENRWENSHGRCAGFVPC